MRLERLQSELEARRPLAFELVRIYLGAVLFVQGLYFVTHVGEVRALLEQGGVRLGFGTMMIVSHYVGFAHLAGGLLLAFGLLTRLAAAIQVPVLLGAVFAVHLREGLFGPGRSLELAALVLFLLVLSVAHGGGVLSIDHQLARGAAQFRTRPH